MTEHVTVRISLDRGNDPRVPAARRDIALREHLEGEAFVVGDGPIGTRTIYVIDEIEFMP